MAIFPPQVSPADLKRICLLRDGLKRDDLQGSDAADASDPKAAVVRPPLAKALAEELRRFVKDEGGFSFIDWAITISIVSMAVGFFIPDLWALFDLVMQDLGNSLNGVAFEVKYLR